MNQKENQTKNSDSEINIIEEDNNNIYIENSQNKNEQIEISKKRQKHLIYYIIILCFIKMTVI